MAAIAAVDLSSATGVEATVELAPFTAADAANGDTTSNYNGFLRLLVKNSESTAATVTVERSYSVDDYAAESEEFTIPASKTTLLGPFPTKYHGSTLRYKFSATTCTVLPLVLDRTQAPTT